MLFVGFLVLRLPLRSDYLVNWDSVNFALGIESFDLVHHQPHPPGYIGYVALGRALEPMVGDANAALTLVSALAGALAPALLFLFCRRLMSHRSALIVAVLFGTSPLVWYYSEVSLTYIVESAIAIVIAWMCFEARTRRSLRHLLIAAGLLAAIGAIRQTSTLLLLPLWIYAAWAFPWRRRVGAVIVATMVGAVWLIPLVNLAGGLSSYLDLSTQLAGLAGGRTWIAGGNIVGILQNVGFVVVGVVVGLWLVALVLPIASLYPPVTEPRNELRRLLVLWGAVPLATFLLVHTGQLGYVLLVLPIGFIAAGLVLDRIFAAHRAQRAPRVGKPVTPGIALLVVLNVVGFFVLPQVSMALVRVPETAQPAPGNDAAEGMRDVFAPAVRQLNIEANDAHWAGLIELVEGFDPAITAVLAEPLNRGSFRHIAYYLPDYTTYGVGRDRNGRYGLLFTGAGGDTDYSVERLVSADPYLVLPSETMILVIPDSAVRRALDDEVDILTVDVEGVGPIGVALVEPGTTLVLDPARQGRVGGLRVGVK